MTDIMLVSVTERTREIGLRLAVGARCRDILRQFLTGAMTVGLVGGLLGVLLGAGSAAIVATRLGWAATISGGAGLLAFGCSAGMGVFFGYYPPRKAARLDPIEALRYE